MSTNKRTFNPKVVAHDVTLHATASNMLEYMDRKMLYSANSSKQCDIQQWKDATEFMYAEPNGPLRNYKMPSRAYYNVRRYCNDLAEELFHLHKAAIDRDESPSHDQVMGHDYHTTKIASAMSSALSIAAEKSNLMRRQSSASFWVMGTSTVAPGAGTWPGAPR